MKRINKIHRVQIKPVAKKQKKQETLEEMVDRGTQKAISEYREVFERLAAYDKA